ncbi:RIP metalloprotease RseP [Marinoscillum sp. MHG1-6]|uniref:RIP metalloprotease RseP n=1 Tax=Marinoscillum sp. MHG1-6 TaxID=2959627 RepID=UPI0021587A14|nr:RIP metalloprotease RseP [Marinoscillum sp. MHG1-6]
MEGLIMAAQLILGLSILVGLHELGHLLAAKAFGMRVEKYSIGFPPKIWGKQFGETEYSIGAIPLGGFVKISGMVDESLDTASLSSEPEPWEFRAKPAWQRLIVMMGGIIVNVITGVVIFIALTLVNGESYLPKQELNKNGIVALELGQYIGLETGDKILDISGKDYEKFVDLMSPEVLLSTDGYFTVDRNGNTVKVNIPNDFIDKFGDKDRKGFIEPRTPFKVGDVSVGSAADKGGLETGDKFLALGGAPVTYFDEFKSVIDTLKGQLINATIDRSGERKELTFQVSDEGTLGFVADRELNYSFVQHGLGKSMVLGTEKAFGTVWHNIVALGKIFTGDVSPSKSLAGPIKIAQIFGGTWNWNRFWDITGMLSMILAFMNFLPIPALDGGHVMFLSYEIVSGRKPSDKFLENAQKIGMILLLGIMGFAIFNDVYTSWFN